MPEDSHDAFQVDGIDELDEVLCDVDIVVLLVDKLGNVNVGIGLVIIGTRVSLVVINLSLNGVSTSKLLEQPQPKVEEELGRLVGKEVERVLEGVVEGRVVGRVEGVVERRVEGTVKGRLIVGRSGSDSGGGGGSGGSGGGGGGRNGGNILDFVVELKLLELPREAVVKLLEEVGGGVIEVGWVDDIGVDGFVLEDDELYNDEDNNDTEIVIEGGIDEFPLVDEDKVLFKADICALDDETCCSDHSFFPSSSISILDNGIIFPLTTLVVSCVTKEA